MSHPFLVFNESMKTSKMPVPKNTDSIGIGDPFVYLDVDNCLIWQSGDDLCYMNRLGDVGHVLENCRIAKRLGLFQGLAIHPWGGEG